jgi:GDPmannose 4,6-dehydratase
MWMMLQLDKPDDYVCATGISHTVGDLVEYTSAKLGLNSKDYVINDQKFFRPEELDVLKGDSSRLREATGWNPKYNFYSMMDQMIEYWLERYKNESYL